ncbi:transposase [Polaromonas sp. A23]|nr:transposase [Polaromonas sp. A23]
MTQLLPFTGQAWPQAVVPRPVHMRVSLAFVEHRVNLWLRFGRPVRETVVDRWRRVATFEPNAVCCRVKWIGNDYGTALWQLMVLEAPMPFDGAQRIAGVAPGARILLRADGEQHVKAVLDVIDAIEALGIDPAVVAVTYWRTVGNRLAARQPPPDYTTERHAAHLARGALR